MLGAEIDLTDCLDLLDSEWHPIVRRAHDDLLRRLRRMGFPEPRQTRGAHRLDREVLNDAADGAAETGFTVRSIRAVFAEGEALYPGSALFSKSHVQVAVRDLSAILSTWHVR